MRLFIFLSFFIFFLLRANIARTQNNDLGGWYIVNFNYFFNPKLNLYSEINARSQHAVNDFYYHEIKSGLSYNLKPNISFLLGFGNYETYTSPGNFKKPVMSNEYRLWEQFTLSNKISRLKLEHRYRIEQRWINSEYRNRFRYRLTASVPINKPAITANTFFVAASDEVFFTDIKPNFIRNRFYGGIGYRFKKLFTLQTGILRQYDYKSNDDWVGKNYLYASFIINAGQLSKTGHHDNTN